MTLIFTLLIIYQLKHFIADYPLQSNQYMLGKFATGWAWVLPLATHCGVHAVMTFVIAMFVKPTFALPLALFDFTCHFTMDRIKASPNLLGKFKPITAYDMKKYLTWKAQGEELLASTLVDQVKSNTYFWWALGIDQMVHHLTHYAIIYWLVSQ